MAPEASAAFLAQLLHAHAAEDAFWPAALDEDGAAAEAAQA